MADNLINRPSVALGLPTYPETSFPNSSEVIPDKTVGETWMEALRRNQSGLVEQLPLSQTYIGERYDVVRPGTDYEEMAANIQSTGQKAARSLIKFGVLTGTTFIGSTVGMVDGLIGMEKTGKAISFIDNPTTRWVDEVNERAREKYAVYQTQAYKDAAWYSPKKLFSANFFWDGIITNLGFSAGMALSALATAGILGAANAYAGIVAKSLKLIKESGKLFSAGRAAETLAAQETALMGAKGAEGAARMYTGITELGKKFLNQYNLLNSTQRNLVNLISIQGESAFESYHNMNDYRNQKIEEYKLTHGGQPPTGEALEAINKASEGIAKASYIGNAAVLFTTASIQLPRILGSNYALDKTLANGVIRETDDIIEKAGEYVVKPKRGGWLLNFGKNFKPGGALTYTFSASEGFEEGAQYAITIGTQHYFDKKYNDLPNDFLDSLIEGVTETLGTNEGMENILIGGLSGAMMMGPGRFMEGQRKKADTNRAIREFNENRLSKFTSETYDAVKRGAYIQAQRDQAVVDGNIVDADDLEKDYMTNYLMPRVKYGRFDLVMSDIGDYTAMAMTDDGFRQLQEEGKASPTDTRENFIERLNMFRESAENMKVMYESLNIRYAGQLTPDKKRKYSDDVIDKMVYATTKIADYDRRLGILSSKLSPANVDVATIMQDLVEGNVEKFNEASSKIKSMNTLDKDDLGEALDSLGEMTLRRNKFLQEYEDIKKNPDKYDEKIVEPVAGEKAGLPEGETVTITHGKGDKKTEKKVQLGKRYFVGKGVNFEKEGLDADVPIWDITFLGEDKDNANNVIIKNNVTGEEKSVSKESFIGWKVGSLDTLKSDELASYYYYHRNEKYQYNFGKNYGGVKEGRIAFEDGKLYFYYKDSKNKLQKKQIFNEHLVAKEGFQFPRLMRTGRFVETADQKTAREKATSEAALKKKAENIEKSRQARLDIIAKIQEELIDNLDKTSKKINERKEKLANIKKAIDAIQSKNEEVSKSGKKFFKETFRKALRTESSMLSYLSTEKASIEKELEELTGEQEDMEIDLSYFQDFTQNISELPEDAREFLDELNNQVGWINDVIGDLKQRKEVLNDLRDKVIVTVKSASKLLKDIINSHQKGQEGEQTLLKEEIDNIIDEILKDSDIATYFPALKENLSNYILYDMNEGGDLVRLEQDMLSQIYKELDEINDELDKLESRSEVTRAITEKFQGIYNNWLKKKEEENKIRKNKKVQGEITETFDSDVQTSEMEHIYEPPSKKTNSNVINGTVAAAWANPPFQQRIDRFGMRWDRMPDKKKEGLRKVVVNINTAEKVGLPKLMEHLLPAETDKYKWKDMLVSVIVRVDKNGKFTLVDEFGDDIKERDDEGHVINSLDHALFQPHPLPSLEAVYEEGGKPSTMFRESTSKEVKDELTKRYVTWRDEQLKKTDLIAEKFDVSFGNPEYVKIEGTDKNDANARISAKDAGLIDDVTLGSTNVISVATTKDGKSVATTTEGHVTLTTPPGTVSLVIPGRGLAKLSNRRLTEKEANSIYDILLQITKNIADKGTVDQDSKNLFDLLKSVVYWGIVKDPVTHQRKPKGRNSIWFETVDEDGKKVPKLFIFGKEKDRKEYVFAPGELENSKNEIISVLQDLYNNVSNWRTKVGLDSAYYEPIGIDENGLPITKRWPNYQTYLLSDSVYDDRGNIVGKRNNEDIPLVTRYVPLKGDNDVNRRGFYLISTENTIDDKVATENKVKSKKEPVVTPPPAQEGYVLDGKTENTFHFSAHGGHDVVFTFDPTHYIETGEISDFKFIQKPQALIDTLVKKNNYSEEDAIQVITLNIVNKLKPDIDKLRPKEEVKEEAKEEKPKEEKPETPVELPKGSTEGFGNTPRKERGSRKVLREKLAKEAKRFTPENWKKVEEFISKSLPNIPIYRVKNIIQATNGRQAWGFLQDGAIYLYENAEIGTVYHEVFEAVWQMFVTPEERASIINEFRSREGSYTDRFTNEKVNYKDATDDQLREELAEEFRDYRLFNKAPDSSRGKSFISRLFRDIINFIKAFFTGEKAANNTKELFDRIGNGYYAQYNPFESALSYAKAGVIDIQDAFAGGEAMLRVANIPSAQLHDIVQHMTFYTLVKLTVTNQSLFNIAKPRKELYDELKEEILDLINGEYEAVEDNIRNGITTEEDGERQIDKLKILYGNINAEWESILEKYNERLKTYSLEFDENDDLVSTDEDNSGKGQYQKADKIDAFKKAHSAIKLLFGTLPMTRDGVNAELSTIGGMILLPADTVYIKLINRLHDSIDIEDMFERLRAMAIGEPNYRALYKRLIRQQPKDNDDGELERLDLSKMETHDLQLLSAFWKAMKKQNANVLSVFILPEGETIIADSALNSAARQAKKEMIGDIIEIMKDEKTPYFKYDSKSGKYSATNALQNVELKSNDLNTYVSFLNKLGIGFKTSDLEKKLTANQRSTFKDTVEGMKKTMAKLHKVYDNAGNPVIDQESGKQIDLSISSISTKSLDIDGDLMRLGAIKAIIEHPDFESTYFNINGERSQTYIGTNTVSHLYDVLSKLNNIYELNDPNLPYGRFRYLLTDKFAAGSIMLRKMFNLDPTGDGRRRENTLELFHPVFIDGTINEERGKKKESSRLNHKERVLQEVNLNTDGVFMNLVPGDAALEHAVRMYHAKNPFVNNDGYANDSFLMIFEDYFKAEVDLARDNRRTAKGKNSRDLRFFKAILNNKKLHDEIVSKENEQYTAEELYSGREGTDFKGYKKEIDKAVKDFIKREAVDTEKLLRSFGIIKTTDQGIESEAGLFAEDEYITQDLVQRKLEVLSANYIIANIELHKLIYSDPYLYSQELKRIKSFTSPGDVLMSYTERIGEALNRTFNKGFEKGSREWDDFNRDHFRAITLNDVKSLDELDMYDIDLFDETDGGGIILLKANRRFGILASDWTDDNERQFRHDMEYERIAKSDVSPEEKTYLLAEHEKNNPDVRSTYTPRKPIVRGSKANGRNYNDVVLHKFALFPMSYRILHKMNPESVGLKLYDKMQKEDIDYAVFASGEKVGTEMVHDIYDENDNFNEAPFDIRQDDVNLPQGVSKIPYSIVSVQSEVPSKDEATVTRGSQITKMSTMNLLEAGVPIDFLPDEGFDDRFEKWNTPESKERVEYNGKSNTLHKEIVRNRTLLEELTEQGYRELLRRLGIKQTDEGFEITDKKKLIATLKDEILKREVNDNIVRALEGFEEGKVVLEATPSYQQIRNILYSIADKNVIRQKISGGMKVQMFSSLLRPVKAEVKEINGKKAYVSNVLKFYKNKDGERVCQIMIARWFDSDMSDEELLEYFKTDEGKRILSGVAFRIPTQNKNSIDVFEIAKFLPKEFGDTVIVPSAIVKKVGSDFDIDKLTIYLKNVLGGRKPRLIIFKDDNNSTVEDRYYDWVSYNADREARNYIKFLSKDEVRSLRGEYKDKLNELSRRYGRDISQIKDFAYEELISEYKQINEDQEAYIAELFETGKAMFRGLSKDVKIVFRVVEDKLAELNIHGPDEISNYRDLSVRLLEEKDDLDYVTDSDAKILNDLIGQYDEELKALGLSKEVIKEAKEMALRDFRAHKTEKVGELNEWITAVRTDYRIQYEEVRAEQKLVYATKLAEMSGLMTLDEFKKLSVFSQNTKPALENEYIESLERITSHPLNFDYLIKPNSAQPMKNLSKEIQKEMGIPEKDFESVGNLISRRFMSDLRHSFMSGRYAIGIAASGQAAFSQRQRVPIWVNTDKIDSPSVSPVDKSWLKPGGGEIYFAEYNSVIRGGRRRPLLSGLKSKNGKDFISDVNSQFIDGYVDISKDTWIIDMGITPNVLPTVQFLISIGVSKEAVSYFINQPIIRDYLRNLENAGYNWLFNSNMVISTLEQYGLPEDFISSPGKMTEKSLFDMLKYNREDMEMSDVQKKEQGNILYEFLKYAKMAEHLFYVTQASNWDTANINDPFLIFQKNELLERARKTIISSVDDILNNSFVNTVRNAMLNTRDSFAEILISDRENVRRVMEEVLRPYVTLPQRDFVRLAQKAVFDMFDWAMQNNTKLNDAVLGILVGKEGKMSAAKEIIQYRDSIIGNENKGIEGKPGHILFNNFVLRNLEFRNRDKGKTQNLAIKARDTKTYNQDLIIYGFEELRRALKAEGNSKLYSKILALSVLQSGLATSPISFTSLLPYEDFVTIYNETLSSLDTMTNLSDFYTLHVFERNNWNNDNIIDFVKARTKKVSDPFSPFGESYKDLNTFLDKKLTRAIQNKKVPKIIKISSKSQQAKSEFIVYTWQTNISASEAKRRRKSGDRSHIHKVLMQRVKDSEGNPYIYMDTFTVDKGKPTEREMHVERYLYKAINAWGDSYRGQELYGRTEPTAILGRQSVLENGFDKVDEVDDSVILDILDGKKAVEERVSSTTPEVEDQIPEIIESTLLTDEDWTNTPLCTDPF